jgi:hypothetical protein
MVNENKLKHIFHFSFLSGESNRALYFIIYITNFIWFFGFVFLGSQRITWSAFDAMIIVVGVISVIYFFRNIPIFANILILFLLFSLLILYAMNIAINGISAISVLKYYYYVRWIPFLLFLAFLIKKFPGLLEGFFKQFYFVLFLQFLINIPFLLYQYTLGYYFDDITGFYGTGAHHLPCFTWLYIVAYQLLKKTKFVFLLIELITMFILAMIMDNKAFYFYLIILVLIFNSYSFKIKKFLKTLAIAFPLVSLLIMGMQLLPKNFSYFIIGMNFNENTLIESKPKSERAIILRYILDDEDSHYFGKGSGIISHAFSLKGALYGKVLEHININDISAIFFEFGAIFYFIFTLLIAVIFLHFFQKRSVVVFAVIWLIFNICLYFTNFVSDPRNFYVCSIIFALFAVKTNNYNVTQVKPQYQGRAIKLKEVKIA